MRTQRDASRPDPSRTARQRRPERTGTTTRTRRSATPRPAQRPAEDRPSGRSRHVIAGGAALGGLLLAGILAGVALGGGGPPSPPAGISGDAAPPADRGPAADALAADYRFADALALLDGSESETRRDVARLRDLFGRLVRAIDDEAGLGLEIELPGHGRLRVLSADDEGIRCPGDPGRRRRWRELGPIAILALLDHLGLDETCPQGFETFERRFGVHRSALPARETAPSPEGSVEAPLPGPEPLPASEPDPLPVQDASGEEEFAAEPDQAVAVDDVAVERDLARNQFDQRLARLQGLRNAYRFEACSREIAIYLEELRRLELADLAARVEALAAIVGEERALFQLLLAAGTVDLGTEVPIGSKRFGVRTATADERGLTLALEAGGEWTQPWDYVPASLAGEVLSHLALTVPMRLALCQFLVERDLDDAALAELGRLVARRRDDPDLTARIHELVAAARGIPVPAGGFLHDPGRGFLTPTEKELHALGLVHAEGQWWTKADHDRIRQGWILQGGTWVKKSHLEALAASGAPGKDGFVRRDGKWTYGSQKEIDGRIYYSHEGSWLPRDEVRAIRRNWEKAWLLECEDYVIRANVEEELLLQVAEALDAAWPIYRREAGSYAGKPLVYYAFGNFEDFRAYCQENGLLEEMEGAQGFVDDKNNRCLAFLGESVDFFVRTSIHELAHLYYQNANPRSYPNSWFAEGFASWFEGVSRTTAGRFQFHGVPVEWAQTLALLSGRKRVPSIADLVRNSSMESVDAGAGNVFYSSSWGLYAWLEGLTEADEPALHRAWQAYLSDVAGGRLTHSRDQQYARGQEGFERLLASEGIDVAEVEAKWKSWIASQSAAWKKLEEVSLFDAEIGRGAAARLAGEPETAGDLVPFRGRRMTVDEIRQLLASGDLAGAPEDPDDDVVRRRVKANTHLFDGGKTAISLPEKNEAWTIEPASGFPLLEDARGVFRIRKSRGAKELVSIECGALRLTSGFSYEGQNAYADDPGALVRTLAAYFADEPGARVGTDTGRFDAKRFVRAVVRHEDGSQRLIVATQQATRGERYLLVVTFAPGAYEVSGKGVDSILESLQLSE